MTQTNRYLCCLVVLGAASLLTPLRLVQVSGESMEPTLHNHQRYLLDRLYYRAAGIGYNDVVVMNHEGGEIVKRVKGLPGDRVRRVLFPSGARDSVINLTRRPEQENQPHYWLDDEMVVPPGKLYVVGDNLQVSDDSRRFGPVPIEEMVGLVRRWNLSRVFAEPEPPKPDRQDATIYSDIYSPPPGRKYRRTDFGPRHGAASQRP
jgi:signal peptidase I